MLYIKNNTWSLVPLPTNLHLFGSKCIYCTKFHSDGSIERHKAHLMAQGFIKTWGLNYSYTSNLVVKAFTVCIILSLPVLNNWHLHQLDVNNAFLQGYLNESVYMD